MAEEQPPPSPGNSDEDWKIFEALCITPAKEVRFNCYIFCNMKNGFLIFIYYYFLF